MSEKDNSSVGKTEETKEKKEKQKVSAIDKYLIFVFTSVIIFTAAVLYIFYQTSLEPTTLIVSFFGLFGGEITILALLKRLKLKKEDADDKKDSKKKEEENVKAGGVMSSVVSKATDVASNLMGGDDDAVG